MTANVGIRVMKKVDVVLSGGGVYDGAKVNEAVLTQLEPDRAGAIAEVA